jgi:capsid protein
MVEWIDTLSIAQGAVPAAAPPAAAPRYDALPAWSHSERRWEGATTDRLNEAHWVHAADESINAWLSEQLGVLRGRALYEAKNNPTVFGMLATHADAIVGPDGPTLQVQSDDARYNDALEQAWQD